eukprot:7382558-Prymnesium_polylepis.1
MHKHIGGPLCAFACNSCTAHPPLQFGTPRACRPECIVSRREVPFVPSRVPVLQPHGPRCPPRTQSSH